MKKLVFEEICLLSKVEKKARRIKFSPNMNVIKGENDVGKSTLIKSLYYCLGADTPKIENTKWKQANPIYLLKFTLNGKNYSIVRDERYFGVFDQNYSLIGRYKGVSAKEGISKFINDRLNFHVDLEGKDEGLKPLRSSYYFLPFYIDQDEGWTKSWTSFVGLQEIKDYRTKMLDYHLGIRSQSYYSALKENFILDIERTDLEKKKNSFIEVRDNFKKRKIEQAVDIDPQTYKADIEELVVQYNTLNDKRSAQMSLIKKERNNKLLIQSEIELLKKSIEELDADYKFCASHNTPDVIDCPYCGSEFKNSVKERFGILDDIDYCSNLIDQRRKALVEIEEKLLGLDKEYDAITKETSSIDALLQIKKSQITLHEIVVAEGYKEMIRSIGNDLSALDTRQMEIDALILEYKKAQRADTELKNSVTLYYQARMKENLHNLNVHVLQESDYQSYAKQIVINAQGSDLPRSLLAQYIAFLETMYQFGNFTACPFVVDSPLQQEQDPENVQAIFDFIFNSTIEDQQLILGTLSVADKVKEESIPENCNWIDLGTKKYSLLQENEYEEILTEIGPLHELTLSSDIKKN